MGVVVRGMLFSSGLTRATFPGSECVHVVDLR